MKAASFVPLFDSPQFHEELTSGNLSFDEQKLWRPLETILLPGTELSVKSQEGPLCQIVTNAYPSAFPVYTHEAFLQPQDDTPVPPPSSPAKFYERIHTCVREKTPYLWGGNVPHGISITERIYPRVSDAQISQLRGVDCSGLIYWASGGRSARNSSDLIHTGSPVPIENLSLAEIVATLRPGMLIGWKGHVLIVTDQGIVESVAGKGVVLWQPQEKIRALLQEGRRFVVRDLIVPTLLG